MSCRYSDIIVTPTELSFEVKEGWKFVSASQYIKLIKSGRGRDPHWTATIEPEADWLRISPLLGTAPGSIKVYCDARGLTAGLYAGGIILDDILRIPVLLTVNAKEVPEIEDEPDEIPPEYTPPPSEPEPEPEPNIPDPQPNPQPDPTSIWERILLWIVQLLGRIR